MELSLTCVCVRECEFHSHWQDKHDFTEQEETLQKTRRSHAGLHRINVYQTWPQCLGELVGSSFRIKRLEELLLNQGVFGCTAL